MSYDIQRLHKRILSRLSEFTKFLVNSPSLRPLSIGLDIDLFRAVKSAMISQVGEVGGIFLSVLVAEELERAVVLMPTPFRFFAVAVGKKSSFRLFLRHTKWWPNRQQAFFMGVAEVNATAAKARSTGFHQPQLEYQRSLAMQMLMNTLDDQGREVDQPRPRRARYVDAVTGAHELLMKPNYAGIFVDGEWTNVRKEYQQNQCRCGNWCRTYCSCTVGRHMCRRCHDAHILEV